MFNNLFIKVYLFFRAAGIKYICDFESPFGPKNKERTAAMVFIVNITQRIYMNPTLPPPPHPNPNWWAGWQVVSKLKNKRMHFFIS
jgi:hypothetical protein